MEDKIRRIAREEAQHELERVSTTAPAGADGEHRLGIGKQARARPPIIHEATTENPDPTEFMPIEVNSAFPEGVKSNLTAEEQTQIDKLIEEVPDKNDPLAINYWRDMDGKKVYLEGWADECLVGTGFPDIGGGEWDDKIEFMVRGTHKTLPEKPDSLSPPEIRELGLKLLEGGFREFEAGDRGYLYGVTWGVYE